MRRLSVAFFGTPDFSVPSLDMLNNIESIDLKYVISMPDRKAGRGHQLKSPEVIQYAKNNNISYFQTENINKENEFLEVLNNENIDVFIVLAFAQFLSEPLLKMPNIGCFNIHTSLLPKYRGAAPIQYAILNGDKSTGVSIQKMVKKMDAGDIALSKSVTISENETGGELYTKLKFQAALSLNQFISILQTDSLSFEKQDETAISFAPTLKREDGYLDFSKESSIKIFNKVRALYPWPGTFCMLNNKRLKVISVSYSKESLQPGEVSTSLGEIHIGCTEGSLRLEQIQLEGKKMCTDRELLNGIKSEININN